MADKSKKLRTTSCVLIQNLRTDTQTQRGQARSYSSNVCRNAVAREGVSSNLTGKPYSWLTATPFKYEAGSAPMFSSNFALYQSMKFTTPNS